MLPLPTAMTTYTMMGSLEHLRDPQVWVKTDHETLTPEDMGEVAKLVDWLLGEKKSHWIQADTSSQLLSNGTAFHLVRDLIAMGL